LAVFNKKDAVLVKGKYFYPISVVFTSKSFTMRNKNFLFQAFLLICFAMPQVGWGQETPPPPAPGTGVPIIVERGSPLTISGNTEICPGTETILKAEGEFESFSWDRGGVQGRYLKVTEPGKYEVTGKTKGGCTFTTTVTVRLRPCPV